MTLPELELDSKLFIDKSVVLYGASDTGKSTVIKNILHILKDHIFQIVVFAGNDDCLQSYVDVVPSPLIHRIVTNDKLERIWKRQEMLTAVYNKATDIKTLRKLCSRLRSLPLSEKIQSIRKTKIASITALCRKYQDNRTDLKTRISKIKAKYNEIIKKYYLDAIRINENRLKSFQDLDDDEQYSLKYYKVNPRLVLIMDDLMTSIKKLKGGIFEDIFYQGRHKFISFMLSLQDDKGLSPELRKNSFVNIFTTKQCANSLFDKKANNYDKEVVTMARNACESAFIKSNEFQKLIHIRKGDYFFKFTADEIEENFRFGGSKVIEFCDRISTDEKIIDTSNPYYDLFSS